MGARNAQRVYFGWGPVLKDRPLRLLVYMALAARDDDSEPWFGRGHAVLATEALGMQLPADEGKPDYPAKRDAVMRKVRRHITPLIAAGAIATRTRATSGGDLASGTHVIYRLYLDGPGGFDDPRRPGAHTT